MEPIIAKNEEQHRDIRQLQEDVRILKEDVQFFKTDSVKMHEQLNQADEQINHNEMHRLQTAIIDFAMQLRNGVLMDRNSFNYICHTYDKYKSMGGNSFADSEMEYILDKKKE